MTFQIPRSMRRICLPEMLNDVVFLDVETTGIQISGDETDPSNNTNSIVSIALIRTHNLEITDRLHLYIDFSGDIPKESSRVHGVTNEVMAKMRENAKDVPELQKDSPSIEDIMEVSRLTEERGIEGAPAVPWRKAANAILSFTSVNRNGGATVCAYNLAFDAKWINFMMGRAIREAFAGKGKTSEYIDRVIAREAIKLSDRRHSLDSLVCSRKLWAGEKGHSLDAAADRLKIDRSARSEFHGAMVDTLLLVDVFRGMVGLPPVTFDTTA